MQERIKEKFGDKALDFALFYNHKGSLRFELASSSSYIEMFLQAYSRAKSVIDFVFNDTDRISICLAFSGLGGYLANLSVFRSLRSCQINIPKEHFAWQKEYQEDDELCSKEYVFTRTFICFEIVKTAIPKFLWGTLANELGIRPRSQCDLYLFDFKTDVLVHPYDDRGMDIIGSNRELLQQTYDKFNEWLPNGDREQMKVYFDSF